MRLLQQSIKAGVEGLYFLPDSSVRPKFFGVVIVEIHCAVSLERLP